MHRKAAAYLLVCALASISAFADPAPRIASTSLCGDSYAMAIAPDQISALSWQSRDPLARTPEHLKSLPQVWDDPEILFSLDTDIILFGPGEGYASKKFLNSKNIQTVDLVWGEDFAAVTENLMALGTAVNAEQSAELVAQQLRVRLDKLNERTRSRQSKPKILYLSRAGGSGGPGTYVDAAIDAAGGVNALTIPGWVSLEPEKLIGLDADLIVTSFFQDGYESVNAAGLRHQAVRQYLTQRAQVNIPGSLWPCAGPNLIEAAELIADALDELP